MWKFSFLGPFYLDICVLVEKILQRGRQKQIWTWGLWMLVTHDKGYKNKSFYTRKL